MRKKIIITAVVIFIFSLVFAILFYDTFNPIEITANDLSEQYFNNRSLADKNYLNKNIILHGQVKAYYKLLGARNVLELKISGTGLPIFCFFLSEENEFKAKQLREDQNIIIKGKCVGRDSYTFVNGIKIEANKIIDN